MTDAASERAAEGRKALIFLGVLAAAAVLALVFGSRVVGLFTGPDVQIVSELKATQAQTLSLEVPVEGAPPLVVHRHFFERILVSSDLEARRAEVSATLDAEGKFGATKVSSVGVERIHYRYEGGEWLPERGFAPRLTAVVALLERRRRALEAGDTQALSALTSKGKGADDRELLQTVQSLAKPQVTAEAWYLRLEREEILVREELRIRGDSKDRPVDLRESKRLSIREEGGEFFFEPGLI